MTKRILILGAAGFLGSNIAFRAAELGQVSVWAHSRSGRVALPGVEAVSGDLLKPGVVEGLVDTVEPDVVINCAALASIDRCEQDPAKAFEVNSGFPARLALTLAQTDCSLVHVSTDAVFGGDPGPYGPDSEPSPVNVYGRSKLDGELGVLGALPSALVLRTNIVGWSPSGSASLLEYFYQGMLEGRELGGFADVWFRPVSAGLYWDAVAFLMERGGTGIRHLVGSERLSKYQFGCRVAECFGFPAGLVRPISVAEGSLGADRGRDLDLSPDPLLVQHRPDLVDLSTALEQLRQTMGGRNPRSSLSEGNHGRL